MPRVHGRPRATIGIEPTSATRMHAPYFSSHLLAKVHHASEPLIITKIMKVSLTILPLILLPYLAFAQTVFLGTNADGIYLAEFDAENGTLTKPKLAAKLNAPGFLAMHPQKPVIYAINRAHTLAAFSIGDGNSLRALGEVNTLGKNPTHLSIDATGSTAAIANYGSGSITTISLTADGKPGRVVSYIEEQGSGPNPKRQNAPHAHGAYFDSKNQFVFVPDLGTDKTLIFRFDASTSEIKEHGYIASAPGGGPRHMAFSPDEKHAYINNELDNTLLAAAYDPENGTLTTIGTYPTLPENFEGENTTAEVEVHPNGRFVYVSNRGHDSIAVFSRDSESGELFPLQHAPCGTKTPRHFKIDPSGKWLLCGGQKSNNLAILPLNPETGLLGEPKFTIDTPSPICILFR